MSSSSSSSSSPIATPTEPIWSKAIIIYKISCLLGDMDLVLERVEDEFRARDVARIVSMADDLGDLAELLQNCQEVDQCDDSLSLIDDECLDE